VHLAREFQEGGSSRRGDEGEESVRSVTKVWGQPVEGGGIGLAKTKENLLGRSRELAEVVETGGLIHDKAGGE